MIPSWLIIGVIAFLVAIAVNRLLSANFRWFMRLRRPRWLTFEWAIPVIWIFIFSCGAWSANLVWLTRPGTPYTWFLMGFYLVLEITILAYTPVMCKLKSLKAGTAIGAIGFVLGLILSGLVFQVSGWGATWLLPFLLWSPVGTYVTWRMIPLNPGAA